MFKKLISRESCPWIFFNRLKALGYCIEKCFQNNNLSSKVFVKRLDQLLKQGPT